jgi:threonine aldolase
MKKIDLRSDTVTRPSPEMRGAMLEAEVGDDVLGDDPTVQALQAEAARLLGKEAALYFPSGTMCNQAAVRALTRRGDEAFLHAQAHIVFYEQGAASALSQVQLRVFDSPDGTLDLEKMEEYVHTDADVHWAPTRLVCLEQTHNHCGGVVVPLEHILAVREFCDRHGLLMHLDGARLFNAVAAAGVSAAEYAAPFDTVSICLSKGLGAPVGSVLVMDAATLPAAARARKVLGGGMRQAGVIAAGGPTTTAARAAWRRHWPRCRGWRSTSAACRPTWCSPAPAGPACRRPGWSNASPRRECSAWTRRRGPCASSRISTSTTRAWKQPSAASSASWPETAALALRRPAG